MVSLPANNREGRMVGKSAVQALLSREATRMNASELILDYVAMCERLGALDFSDFVDGWLGANTPLQMRCFDDADPTVGAACRSWRDRIGSDASPLSKRVRDDSHHVSWYEEWYRRCRAFGRPTASRCCGIQVKQASNAPTLEFYIYGRTTEGSEAADATANRKAPCFAREEMQTNGLLPPPEDFFLMRGWHFALADHSFPTSENEQAMEQNQISCHAARLRSSFISGGLMRISLLWLRLERVTAFSLLLMSLMLLPMTAYAQLAVAGQTSGPGVTVIDVSVPGTPVLRGMVNTVLTGISSIAVDPTGSRVVAGEFNGCRISLINITNPDAPVQTGTVCTGFSGVSSVAVSGSIAVVGQELGPSIEIYNIAGATPVKIGSTLNTVLTGISSVAASGTCAIAGETNGNRIVGINIGGANPVVAGSALNIPTFVGVSSVGLSGGRAVAGQQSGPGVQTFSTSACALTLGGKVNVANFVGVRSVALSGTRALAGEENGPDVGVVDVTTVASPTQVGASLTTAFSGGSSVAANGALGVLGQLFGPGVRTITGLNAAPALGGSVLTTFSGVSSVALTSFSPPRVSLSSSSLSFGNVTTGTTKVLTLTISNVGGSPLSITAIASTSPRYTFTPATLTIPAGGSGTLNVTFAPTAVGPVNATLSANTNDPLTPTISVALTGTGTAPPPAIVVATSFPLGVVRVNTTSSQGLTVQNAGGLPLNVSAIASSDPHFVPAVTSLTVPPGVTLMINIAFTPNAETAFNGNLTANTNDPLKPTILVALSGMGGLPHIAVSPNPLAFGNVAVGCAPSTIAVTVSNTGALQLTVSPISPLAAPFARTPSALTIPGSGNAPVQVTFTPTALGAASATMTLANDDPDPAKQNLAVSITGAGVTAPPPVIAVSPGSINFGATLVNFFIGKRVTIQNTGTCTSLNVTLSSASAVFPVTADPNPTSVPPLASVSSSIAPGASQSFVAVYAPTATGPASGTLTIGSNDPANPSVAVALSGTGVQAQASSLSLVFDRSGSMADPVGAGTKIDALKASAKLFTDLIIEGQGDRLGTVEFDNLFSVLTPIADVDAAHKVTVKSGIDSLFPGDGTSIGGGLQTGLAQLSGSTTARQIVMVFTDGQENEVPMIATVKPSIPTATEVYAVGLGDPAQISAAALTDLAITSNGRFFNPQDPLILRKDFVQVLSDAFRLNMAADPVYTITKGATSNVFVPLSTCDHRMSFIVYWEKAASQLGVEIVAPNGMTYTAASPTLNRLVRYVTQPGYRFYQIAFPPVDSSPGAVIGPPRAGNWIVRVTGDVVSGNSERFSVSVLVESDLAMKVAIDDARIGRPVTLTARLTESGKPVRGALVTARLRSPQRSVGHALVDLAPTLRLLTASRPSDADKILDRALLIRRLDTLPRFHGRPIVPTKVTTYQLFDDGKHGDGADGDGVYGIVLPPLSIDGGYTVEIKAQAGVCQGRPTREATLSFYPLLKVDSANTAITVVLGTTPGLVTVNVTPAGTGGLLLGPGLATAIKAQVSEGGGRVAKVKDNLNGSYSIIVQEAGPGAVLQLDIGGTAFTVPLRRTKAPAKE